MLLLPSRHCLHYGHQFADRGRCCHVRLLQARTRRTRCIASASSAPAQKCGGGSIWSSALLVAGTTVGAGILALPAVTADAGFAASGVALTACSIFSIATGLLIAEVNIRLVRSSSNPDATVSVLTMAQRTLGDAGAAATGTAYVFLHYALLVAYIAKAGELLADAAHLPILAAAPLFAGTVSGGCYLASAPLLERVNNTLVLVFIATFAVLVALVGQHVAVPLLAHAQWSAVPATLPVVALAFVYHNIVPVVCRNLDYNIAQVRTAIVAGVALSLAMFLTWEGAILGTPPTACLDAPAAALEACVAAAVVVSTTAAADPLRVLQAAGGAVGPVVGAFSFLAVSTSYIGFILGLTDFLADALKLKGGPQQPITYALTTLPPLGLALTFPGLFFSALDSAGTYGVMTLFGLLPAAMAWKLRYPEPLLPGVLAGGGVVGMQETMSSGRGTGQGMDDDGGTTERTSGASSSAASNPLLSGDGGRPVGNAEAGQLGVPGDAVPGGKLSLLAVALIAGSVILNTIVTTLSTPGS